MIGASIKQPKDVTILAVLEIFVGFNNLIFPHYFLILTVERVFGIIFDYSIYWLISFSMAGRILGIISLVLSWGLWNQKQWAFKGTLILVIFEIVNIIVSVPLFPNTKLIDPYRVMRAGFLRYGGKYGPMIGTLIIKLGLFFIIFFNIIINGIILYYLMRPRIRTVFKISLPMDILHLTALECFVGFYSILCTYYIYRAPLDIRITEFNPFLVMTGFCSLVVGFGLWTLKNGAYQSAIILSIIGIFMTFFQRGYLFPLLISQGIIIYYLIQPEIKDIFRISDNIVRKLINGALFLVILGLPITVAFVEGSWEETRQLYLASIFSLFYYPVYFCFLFGFGLNSNFGCVLGFLLGLSVPMAILILGIKYRKDKWTVLIILQAYILLMMIRYIELFYF